MSAVYSDQPVARRPAVSSRPISNRLAQIAPNAIDGTSLSMR